jgi:hypothetical protein
MAAIPSEHDVGEETEPERGACELCKRPVLVFLLNGKRIAVEPHEWEPRAACYVCAQIRKRGQSRRHCPRCGGTGYVGSKRPAQVMIGVDIAWSDEGHIRLVGPRTKRMRGEALMPLHACRPA